MTQPDNNHQNRSLRGIALLGLIALLVFGGLGIGTISFMIGRATAPLPTTVPAAIQVAEIDPTPTDTPIEVIAEDVEGLSPEEPTLSPFMPEAEPTVASEAESAGSMPLAQEAATITPPATPTPEQLETTPVLPDGSPLEDSDLSVLFEVWELIADQYDGEVPLAKDVIESAIAGSLDTLDDDFTRYVSPEVARRMREDMQGAVEGIGAFVRENEEGQFEIVRPIDGQPAALAGLKPGDVLIAVDGESVDGVNFDEVILMVRGPKDTSVTLTVLREGEEEPLEFTVVRTRFEVPVVEAEMLPDEMTGGQPIAYLRLTEFNRNAEERLLDALNTLLAAEPAGLILDLRDNPGGFLDQSVAVADAFLDEGVVLFERNIRGLDETFATDDGDLAESIPLVVLVNAGSASASEIVAGAIQDRGRAILIGETTFGKGSVQQIYPLTDGSELRVTIARWYTPNNNTIDGQGIEPDIEIESPETLGGMDDTQLRRAVDYLLTGQ